MNSRVLEDSLFYHSGAKFADWVFPELIQNKLIAFHLVRQTASRRTTGFDTKYISASEYCPVPEIVMRIGIVNYQTSTRHADDE